MRDVKPGNFELQKIVLKNQKGDSLDIREYMTSLKIYEDLFSTTLSAELSILESIDLIKNFPIVGEEKLQVRFRTAENFRTIEIELYSYYVKPILQTNQFGGRAYTISFISREKLVDQTKFINRSFSNTTSSDIIKNILSTELESKKKVEIHPTQKAVNYIPARQRPFEVVMLQCARSKCANTGNPVMVFYESVTGYKLHSLERLVQQVPVGLYNIPNKATSNDLDNDIAFLTLTKYKKVSTVSSMDKINSGAVSSNVSVFDPITRTMVTQNRSVFNPSDYGQNTKLQNGSPATKLTSDSFEFKDNDAMHKFMVKTEKSESTLARYQMLNQYTNGIRIHANMPGNSNLSVGMVIGLLIPRNLKETSDSAFDEDMSGKFLITAMCHSFSKTQYTCVVELAKDSYSASPLAKASEKFNIINSNRVTA